MAEYLQVSRAFIAMVETGKSKLPPDKILSLQTNNEGWDASMLVLDEDESKGDSSPFKCKNVDPAFLAECLEIWKENQRQMGQLIETISVLTAKLK